MHRTALLVVVCLIAGGPLAGCATPEELAARSPTLGRDTQTGTRIPQGGSARTDAISDGRSVDDALKDLRNLPAQTAMPPGSGL